jgi:hypothetical protein
MRLSVRVPHAVASRLNIASRTNDVSSSWHALQPASATRLAYGWSVVLGSTYSTFWLTCYVIASLPKPSHYTHCSLLQVDTGLKVRRYNRKCLRRNALSLCPWIFMWKLRMGLGWFSHSYFNFWRRDDVCRLHNRIVHAALYRLINVVHWVQFTMKMSQHRAPERAEICHSKLPFDWRWCAPNWFQLLVSRRIGWHRTAGDCCITVRLSVRWRIYEL